MQLLILAGVIHATLIKVLVGDTFTQLLKATSIEMTAWPSSHTFVTVREYLAS